MRRWRGQLLEKIRERFLHARGIINFYAGNFQSQNGKTHGHAMVIVGCYLRAVQFSRLGWINRQGITVLDNCCAALGQWPRLVTTTNWPSG